MNSSVITVRVILPPDRGNIPVNQLKLVFELPTMDGCNAELTYMGADSWLDNMLRWYTLPKQSPIPVLTGLNVE